MQHRGCEETKLLLSKYADGEATPAERTRVENHVASCVDCSRKLAEYSQLASILSGSPRREPEPSLRVDVFRQIHQIEQEEERAGNYSPEHLPWLPRLTRRSQNGRRQGRFWAAASPLMVASAAVFTILGLAFFINRGQAPVKTPDDDLTIQAVPTAELPVQAQIDGAGSIPPAIPTQDTRIGALLSPSVPADLASATAFATALSEGVFRLTEATPVMEQADPKNAADWHAYRDPAYGYAVSYPPNWWTYTSGGARVFAPWWISSPQNMPYWVEMQVQANTGGLSVETAPARLFNGDATIINNRQGRPAWVRHTSVSNSTSYDELYSFDEQHVYTLRLCVSVSGYWHEAEDLFSGMSGTFAQASRSGATSFGYAPIIFLNGTDLFMVEPNGQSRALTHGYGVRQFSLSPDMRTLVFSTTKNSSDIWASSLYTLQIDGDTVGSPVPLWTGAQEIHDLAWYGDHELVSIVQSSRYGFGLFRIAVSQPLENAPPNNAEPHLVCLLPDAMAGAKGLAVSPDRQLITFLAPFGEHMGTDLYAVRPDGRDLDVMISHADPVSPSNENGRIFTRDSQAIKSYVWVDGHLDQSGYRFHVLLTCGNAASPTFFRGGFLYSAPGAISNVLLNQNDLSVADANQMQIVHLAYSDGKLAMTGYYNDRKGRADLLAGLWVADVGQNGALTGMRSLPIPVSPHGITDLQWSPDGQSIVYRETVPLEADSLSSRYDAGSQSPFKIVKLDPATGQQTELYTAR